MKVIFHITTVKKWTAARKSKTKLYTPDAFAEEGFIHCCASSQVAGVLNRYFKAEKEVLILAIILERVQEHIKYEMSVMVDELFPHLYCPLQVGCVASTFGINKDKSGNFDIPYYWLNAYV